MCVRQTIYFGNFFFAQNVNKFDIVRPRSSYPYDIGTYDMKLDKQNMPRQLLPNEIISFKEKSKIISFYKINE